MKAMHLTSFSHEILCRGNTLPAHICHFVFHKQVYIASTFLSLKSRKSIVFLQVMLLHCAGNPTSLAYDFFISLCVQIKASARFS